MGLLGAKVSKDKGYFKNAKMDGEWNGWYENGAQKYCLHYKNGELNGLYTYYWEETGKMARQGNYKANQRNGLWKEFAQNGKILNEGKYVKDMKQGKWSFYNVFEKKIREQNFVDNVQDGPFTEYYDNGTKHFEGSFKGRLRDGKWSCWKPNGDLYYSVIFSNGKKVKELYVNDPSATKPF